ncbi:MAG: DUF1788 domain-containing protein [Bdellovibrionota bacterium]|nr:DUF1788 domain-containing protein [Bdellovibrionota bacterium]
MPKERSLNERFASLERKMSDSHILLDSGKANELNFFIFDYDPKQELIVRNEVRKLKKNNPNIIEFDLFNIVIELLENQGYLERVKDFETQYDSSTLLSQLFQPFLSLEEDKNPILDYVNEHLIDDDNHIVLITGVGKVYPFIRSHTILNKLQSVIRNAPVVMMYPGRYNQKASMCLRLFDRLEDDNYYRAFSLEERMVKDEN